MHVNHHNSIAEVVRRFATKTSLSCPPLALLAAPSFTR